MSHRLVFAMPLRRIVAAVATLAIAALATVITSPTARAAVPDMDVVFGTPTIAMDMPPAGLVGVGDVITVTAQITNNTTNAQYVYGISLNGIPYLVSGLPLLNRIGAGETKTATLTHVVGVGETYGLGGMSFTTAEITYARAFRPSVTDAITPPAGFAPGDPFSASSLLTVTEGYGAADGLPTEGDGVVFATTITNTTGAYLNLTSMPGYGDFVPTLLAAGEAVTFHASVTTTLADMVTGSISFPATTVAWEAGALPGTYQYAGTKDVAGGSVNTEAINSSFTADVTTEVHQGSTDTVAPLGTAVAGDEIDYTFSLTNTGNVTYNYAWLHDGYGNGNGRDADAGLVPGGSLPTATFAAVYMESQDGVFNPHVLTDADIELGYVDMTWTVSAAPTKAMFDADPAAHTFTVNKRVYLRDFNTRARLTFTDATLNDTNGDGIGQEGETVHYRVRFKNNADQALLIDSAGEVAGSDLSAPLAAKFNGRMLAREEVVAKQWEYTITAADEARGTLDLGVAVNYTGQADWATDSREVWAPQIATGPYVAPSTTFVTSATFDDDNTDGFPSIGETVHFTVTVTNTGTYDLTNLVVSDGTPADVTGLLPAFSSTIAAGASEAQTFDYVITPADYARGTLGYTASMVADGMAPTLSNTELLVALSFAAYDTDLVTEGGIVVCFNGVDTSTVTIGTQIDVMPGDCAYAGDPLGSRVVGFSTPMTMGVDTYTVTVPGQMGVGTHRIALYGADGALVGFKTVQLVDPVAFSADDETLAFTGTDNEQLGYIAGGGAALVLLGSAMLFGSSRLRRRAA